MFLDTSEAAVSEKGVFVPISDELDEAMNAAGY